MARVAKQNPVRSAFAHWYDVAPVGMRRRSEWRPEQVQPDWAKWSIVFMIRGRRMDTVLTPQGWFALHGGRPVPQNLLIAPPIPGIQELTLNDGGSGEPYQAWGLVKTGRRK